MSYNILAVLDASAADSPHYPTPAEVPDSVELVPEDREPLTPLTATELVVTEMSDKGRRQQVMRVSKMKAKVIITEYRVAIACSKYEKGGGWVAFGGIGALLIEAAANTASKVRAARRRRGKMLAGHVRYVQLVSVGFKPPSGIMKRDTLRLGTFDPTAEGFRVLTLDLTLAGGQSASYLAEQIACRAAHHELTYGKDEMDDERRELLEALREPEPLVAQPKKFSSYFLIATGASGLDAALEAS